MAVFLLLVGSLGYVRLEGWSFPDALYMTVITLTAVGYSEVHPLSDAGRAFTIVLLGGGITWMGLWFALVTSLIVELDLSNVFRRRRLMKDIERLSNHVIVCGAGRTGRQVIHELERYGAPWVAIEKKDSHIDLVTSEHPDALVIEGDATHDSYLVRAGVERAQAVLTCLSADTDNVFVCLSVREFNSELPIVARAYEDESVDKLYRAGATYVVSPNVSGANRMAAVLLRPSVVSFLDIATRSSDIELRMEETSVGDDSSVVGQTLAEARIPQTTGLIVIAVRKKEGPKGNFLFNPVAGTRLAAGDELIVLGRDEQIAKLREYVGG